jgi:hypothetical protein
MTEQRKRGRPKKDPNAPKSNYYYSFAVKARKQSQKRLRDAEIIQSPHLSIKKIYTVFLTLLNSLWMGVKLFFNQMKGLKKSFCLLPKGMCCTVGRQGVAKASPCWQIRYGIVIIAIIVGFFSGVLWMS